MKLIDTLKWLWDPRTEEQKKYEEDPLQRHTQELKIYIKGIDTLKFTLKVSTPRLNGSLSLTTSEWGRLAAIVMM